MFEVGGDENGGMSASLPSVRKCFSSANGAWPFCGTFPGSALLACGSTVHEDSCV